MTDRLRVVVRRRDHGDAPAHWETFSAVREEKMTVADLLHAVNAAPCTIDGQPTTPIAWASACTWPACGVCTMVINGRAAPACGTRVDAVVGRRNRLLLRPMEAFPVRRDLWVDRSRMWHDAARVQAHPDEGDESGVAPGDATWLSACTRCGACVEACPEAHTGTKFVGPYAIGAVHATRVARGRPPPLPLLESGGIVDCGHVQNCVETCPERIPLDRAVRAVSRASFRRWLSSIWGK
jgi:succinate dehydrogenase / fumarate reductase iron-sulfur subunit